MTDLPQSVLDLTELSPIEDFALAILREGLPDVAIVSLIAEAPPEYFVLVRRMAGMGIWRGDERFTDSGRIAVHVFTSDPDGDEKGALLSEAVRVVFRNASRSNWRDPDLGSVIRIKMVSEPSRKTDWASATGPVQYADLPTGKWRYESAYEIRTRKPR